MSATSRLLIYACGTPTEVAEQQEQCLLLAASYGPHEIVSIATDRPGQTAAWASALAMHAAGEVDRILCVSRDLVPALDPIDSVTREVNVPPRALQPSPRHRRTRPLRRGAGGA